MLVPAKGRVSLLFVQDAHTSFMRLNWYPVTPDGEGGLGINQHTGEQQPGASRLSKVFAACPEHRLHRHKHQPVWRKAVARPL